MPPRSLNALDEQIAALKRKLREAAGSDGDDRRGAPYAESAASRERVTDRHPRRTFPRQRRQQRQRRRGLAQHQQRAGAHRAAAGAHAA